MSGQDAPNLDTPVWRRAEIASPCVNICVIQPGAGLCVGCLRTGEEITRWSGYTDAQRAAIMAELPDRAPLLTLPENRPSRRRRRD